jgi:hypothetical protein
VLLRESVLTPRRRTFFNGDAILERSRRRLIFVELVTREKFVKFILDI